MVSSFQFEVDYLLVVCPKVTKGHTRLLEITLKHCIEAVSALPLRAASAVTACLLPLRAAQPAVDQLTPGNGKHTDVTSRPARRRRLVLTITNRDFTTGRRRVTSVQ